MERLETYVNVGDLNRDNPTPEENTMQQEMAYEIIKQRNNDSLRVIMQDSVTQEQARERVGEKEVAYWTGVAEIILPRLDGITARNIRDRLRQARELEFPVKKGISKMTKQELRDYYFDEVRQDVYEGAKESCPDVVSRILAWNRDRKKEAEKYWMRH